VDPGIVGTPPAVTSVVVDVVFQYRTLIGKCELGIGLDLEEIDHLATIEQAFASRARKGSTGASSASDARRFRRDKVELVGMIRGDRINDRVAIVELGPGGLVCRRAPFIARGELVELVIDDGDRSYRFGARGVWLRDDGDDYRVAVAFTGMPVCITRLQLSKHQPDLVDQIAAAA
jgi:hypothetical protein